MLNMFLASNGLVIIPLSISYIAQQDMDTGLLGRAEKELACFLHILPAGATSLGLDWKKKERKGKK